MPPTSCHRGPARSEAARANARIRELMAAARDEVRDLTPDERAEYERLRAVYVRATLAA